MIPLRLKLSGFLSYRDPVEVDFTGFNLACISGQNGAGKSSLLDAMTWALFGEARKRDDAIINSTIAKKEGGKAEVSFIFEYEKSIYRILRILPAPTIKTNGRTNKTEVVRKPTTLEFQLLGLDIIEKNLNYDELIRFGSWKSLTEHTVRETQARIEKVLRLDYDTFINVSFFLQGRADEFAQQVPTRRKEILGNILGLEIWEVYKERTAERRKVMESRLDLVDGQTSEIDAELAEEEPRKARLKELETQLSGLAKSRKAQEAALASVRQVHAGLEKQREMVGKIAQALKHQEETLSSFIARLVDRENVRRPHAELVGQASKVEADYADWQQRRRELEKWDAIASQFHEQEKLRLPFLNAINAETAKLEQEKATLEEQEAVNWEQSVGSADLTEKVELGKIALAASEAIVKQLAQLEKQYQAGRERQAELRAENTSLRAEMNDLDERKNKLITVEGATCPLCGQSLTEEHRQSTLERLQGEGKQKGDIWRANKLVIEGLATDLTDLERQISNSAKADSERLSLSNSVVQLTERLEALKKQNKEWETKGSKRLARVKKILESGKFAVEARKELAKVDKELATLGYQAAEHDAARRAESGARTAEAAYRELEAARAALKPLEDEIANLTSQVTTLTAQVAIQQTEHQSAEKALAEVEAQAPDLDEAERSLFDTQERENQLNQEVGAARQKVTVLDDLRRRKKKLGSEREELGLQIGRYKALERAFGKDGVPALLIEQALPEIEMKANEILGRLSNDSMRLRFETQTKYKAEKRKDLRETLEIQVSDEAGERDYEMFSGGEAFRVNFAIRLALSEVLAQRKGARLQMLVIDEGFGSQDAQGRQRLVKSINAVRDDFAKILVITHLDELKDSFPNRIEVEKTETGSSVTVI